MTNTGIADLLTSPSARCAACGISFSRRRDIPRHTARKHAIVPTALADLVIGDLVEWAGDRRIITDVRLTPGRKPIVRMGRTFRVTVPSTTFRFRKVSS